MLSEAKSLTSLTKSRTDIGQAEGGLDLLVLGGADEERPPEDPLAEIQSWLLNAKLAKPLIGDRVAHLSRHRPISTRHRKVGGLSGIWQARTGNAKPGTENREVCEPEPLNNSSRRGEVNQAYCLGVIFRGGYYLPDIYCISIINIHISGAGY